ncbi:MAG: ImmA/IrrE family metallo-endopeptidase [Gammaproteobacteria bacterium]|nr:ImmA/IrrE family metallo-endopeptidase [Gammaproteobacteria bacterium]
MAMNEIKPIRTETDYETALARIDLLMGAEPGSEGFNELDVLADLVEHYEDREYAMGYPSPIAAIEFRMEQANLTPRDLIPILGSRAKVSEVLSGKRAITMPMARALHEHLGIPADVLIQEPKVALKDSLSLLNWNRFPLKAMASFGWISNEPRYIGSAKEIMVDLITRSGGLDVASAATHLGDIPQRTNAKTDPYALKAWCWYVLANANENNPNKPYRSGTVTLDFLTRVARQSWFEDGPRRARDLLAENGISLVVAQHLPKLYVDGAALRLGNGRPVIGLTLRNDRVDSFWFCLLHELAHVGRHLDATTNSAFFDDMSLRKMDREQKGSQEKEADAWAEAALIPKSVWDSSDVKERPSPTTVMHLANTLKIHPAIVADRVRHDQQNYRLLPQFVGTGEVKRWLT